MHNFSDLTVTETVNVLNVELRYKVHGYCLATVCINDLYYIEPWQSVGYSKIPVNLFDPISLKINLLEFKEGTSGIEIEYFGVNGLEVLPKYQHYASKSTNYIDFYGDWTLEIPSPFYIWYHQITGQGWIA
jgi:hypothetical protein